MKKNISINLQGIIFYIEDDGYEVLSRYLQEVKAHFASYQGHEEIVADIEGRIAELFAARVSASKQVITLADVEEMTAKMGRVSDFAAADDDDEPAVAAGSGFAGSGATVPPVADGQPRRLYRDLAHRKVAGVAAGLAQYFMVNPLWIRLGFLLLVLLPNSFMFFNHGPFRTSFNLGSLAVVAYAVLWIALPKRYDAPEPIDTLSNSGPLAGRKLYRDTTDGKVGGVAAGLAAYFNVDVTVVRIAFLLALFLAGTGVWLYVVLWIVVPEARTVSERMQMRGDAVTLSGIDENLRAGAADAEPGSRPVGTFFENAARGAQPAVGLLGTALRWIVGLLLIFWGGSWLLTVLTLLGAALSIIPFTAVEHTSNGFMFDDGFGAVVRNLPPWGAAAGGLLLGIPALGLMLLGVRLLLRRPLLGRSAGGVLLGLWLLGVVGAVAAGLQVARDFQTKGTYTTTVRFTPQPGRNIVLDSRNMEHYEWVNHLGVVPADSGAAPYVEEEFQANGRTEDAARLTAQQTMLYRVEQHDSVITFDQGYQLKDSAPFRNQRLRLTLHLPLDKTYRLTPLFIEHLRDEDFDEGRHPKTDRSHRFRFTREGKFACLDCSAADLEANDDSDDDAVVNVDVDGHHTQVRVNTDDDDEDGDGDLHISTARSFNTDPAYYGAGRKTLDNPDEFSEVEVQGPYRVLVRQGDSYQVDAAGRESDLDNLRLEVRGNRLVVRNRHDRGGLFEAFRNHRPVLVRVTLPTLRHLELSAACEANVSGFRNDDLHLEASSAATVRLDVHVPRLEVQLSSASHADLTGTADELAVDGSSASELAALGLTARQVKLELSSGSEASVHATDELVADLSSGSSARYAGHPARVEKDLSSGGSLEQVRD